jgi:D-alanyl-D-alanine carboxypeptidase
MRAMHQVESLLSDVSHEWWTDDPAPTRALLDQLEADLAAGSEPFADVWGRGVIPDHSLARIDNPLPPAMRYRLGSVAERMAATLDAVSGEGRCEVAYLCSRFFDAAGQSAKALVAGEDALRHCLDPHSVTALRARSLLADLRWREQGREGAPPLAEYLDAERARSHIPGLALGIVRDGQLLLSDGWGAADIAAGLPATPETIYQICSITKTFTATGLMLLAHEGRLTLQDPIVRWLPQLPSTLAGVTLRHMLSHTSGIRNIWERMVAEVRVPDDLVRIGSELVLESVPGERYNYNNTAFHLLGLVLPAVTGMPFAEFIEERMMRPLGMQITPSQEPSLPNDRRARGYTWDSGKLQAVSEGRGFWSSGAGGFASSVSDLIRWDAALEGETLLPHSTWEQVWTPSALNSGETVGTGLGWGTGALLGRRKVGHLGGDRGFRSNFMRYLEDRLTVIFFANSDKVDQSYLEEGIAKYFLRPLTLPVDPDPAMTAHLKQIWIDMSAGRADPSAFSPETRKLHAAALTETAAFYRALGPLTAFNFIERRSAGSSTTFRYRIQLGNTPWVQSLVLNEAGQVTDFSVEQRRAL